MKKSEIKILIIVILIFALMFGFFLLIGKEDSNGDIKLSEIKIEDQEKLLLTKEERKKCINGLINYLNSKHYYICEKIRFYNNKADNANNKKYFYALVIGGDESLIEITNLGNGKFKYTYIGNEVTPDEVSEETGVSYNQIINYEEYKIDKELEEIREEAKSAQPDDTEMP